MDWASCRLYSRVTKRSRTVPFSHAHAIAQALPPSADHTMAATMHPLPKAIALSFSFVSLEPIFLQKSSHFTPCLCTITGTGSNRGIRFLVCFSFGYLFIKKDYTQILVFCNVFSLASSITSLCNEA